LGEADLEPDDGLAAQAAMTELFQHLPGGVQVNGGSDARGDRTCARHSRCACALRPPCTAVASSSAPTSRIALYKPANGLPLMVTDPAVGRSSPRIIRIVVVLPNPRL
jgi:hypothetical protein